MRNREQIRLGLEQEYSQLNDCINGLRQQVETSAGAIQLYRRTRLDRAVEAKEQLNSRLELLTHTKGEQRWSDAEKLWSDVRNAVLGITARA